MGVALLSRMIAQAQSACLPGVSQLEESRVMDVLVTGSLLNALPGCFLYAASILPGFRVFFVSRKYFDLTGQSGREAVEDEFFWMEQIHPRDQQAYLHALVEAAESGERDFVYQFLDAGGRWLTFRDRMRCITPPGEPPVIVGLVMSMPASSWP